MSLPPVVSVGVQVKDLFVRRYNSNLQMVVSFHPTLPGFRPPSCWLLWNKLEYSIKHQWNKLINIQDQLFFPDKLKRIHGVRNFIASFCVVEDSAFIPRFWRRVKFYHLYIFRYIFLSFLSLFIFWWCIFILLCGLTLLGG